MLYALCVTWLPVLSSHVAYLTLLVLLQKLNCAAANKTGGAAYTCSGDTEYSEAFDLKNFTNFQSECCAVSDLHKDT